MKVFEAISDSFAAEEVTLVASLMGDSNMMFHDDLVRRHGIRVINVRHENAAVALADGYARATGKVGVATVTCGPGLTQIITALTASARLRVPLIVFIGDTPSTDLWNPQALDLGTMILPTGAAYAPIRSLKRIAETIGHAFLRAKNESRPVVISIPYDIQEHAAPNNFVPCPSTSFFSEHPLIVPLPSATEAAVKLLVASKRPVIVAGRGAIASGAKAEILDLAERNGALLATSLKAKNWFDNEKWNLGVCGYLGSTNGRKLLADADLIVGVGAQLGYFSSDHGELFPKAKILQIDTSPCQPIEGYPFAGVFVTADARLGVKEINTQLRNNDYKSVGFRTDEVAQILNNPIDEWLPSSDELGRVDPTLAMRVIDSSIGKEHQYVFGVGHFWSFAIMNSHRVDPLDFIYAYAFGSIGHALPVAIGATIGRDRPTVLIDGDGSLLMQIGELGTVASEALDLTIIVMNDGGYGSEIHKLRAKGGDGELARFHDTDFAAVARGFGLEGYTVTKVDEISMIIDRQRETKKPTLIDIRINKMSLSAPTRRIWFPDGDSEDQQRKPKIGP